MAERRPLVLVSGAIEELPSGDTLPGGGGGGSYSDEQAQDAIGGILVDSDTITISYNDSTPAISAAVRTQYSLTATSEGLYLQGDVGSPGNDQYWGTNDTGDRGWYALPALDGIPINALGDATDNGTVNCGFNEITFEWPDLTGETVGDAFTINVNGSDVLRTAFNAGTILTLGGNFVGIGDSATSSGVTIDPNGPIYIGTGSSTLVVIGNSSGTQTLGFFGAAGAIKQTVSAASTGVMDGAIAALSFSSTPTQAECETLRDYCEYLRDWIEEVRTRSNELNFALASYGLISNGL